MSYDLVFVRRRPLESWGRALSRMERAASVDQKLASQEMLLWQQMSMRVLALWGEEAQVNTVEGDDSCEITNLTSGVSLFLAHGEAGISGPYGVVGDEARAVVDVLFRMADIVQDETGFEGYDGQLETGITKMNPDRIRDLAVDVFEFVASRFSDPR